MTPCAQPEADLDGEVCDERDDGTRRPRRFVGTTWAWGELEPRLKTQSKSNAGVQTRSALKVISRPRAAPFAAPFSTLLAWSGSQDKRGQCKHHYPASCISQPPS